MKKAISAVALKDSKVLMVEKGIGWIFPGGKPEKGESDEECLYREVGEELPESKVRVCEYFGSFKGKSTNKKYTLEVLVYFTIISGNTKKTGREVSGSDARWLSYDEIGSKYYVSDVTRKILDSLKSGGYL